MADDIFLRWLEEAEGRRGAYYNALRPGFGQPRSLLRQPGFIPNPPGDRPVLPPRGGPYVPRPPAPTGPESKQIFPSSVGKGFMRGQMNYLQSIFPQMENRYLGALAGQIQGGGAPTMQWSDWLQQNFNPYKELLRAPQYQTGTGTQNLFSSPRYLYNF